MHCFHCSYTEGIVFVFYKLKKINEKENGIRKQSMFLKALPKDFEPEDLRKKPKTTFEAL